MGELKNAAYKDGCPDPLWGAALSCWWKARRAVQKYSILSGTGSMGGEQLVAGVDGVKPFRGLFTPDPK